MNPQITFEDLDKKYTHQEYQMLMDRLVNFCATNPEHQYNSSFIIQYLDDYIKQGEVTLRGLYYIRVKNKSFRPTAENIKSPYLSEAMQKTSYSIFAKIFLIDLDEVPLILTQTSYEVRTIAAWRLEIGK